MEEPFTVYQVLPRSAVPFGDGALSSLDVGGGVLTTEVDSSVEFFKFFRDLVCCKVCAGVEGKMQCS